ncbi:hypothetical protein GK047_14695 [Paenibacillus sp. SYP-B3998]|uniref:Uncharacterized protein n=1 Tax=Paenibacillus sp. SYP-B3998 TaxID=2678564 RepID=A0A6G3ZYR4_9BACL|nr:hypothetical protein [Paenibacillus sp. SYP-B3998]NEW07255.1 hypothetical protein [Paenibacillus sp. SYP-B3998]
MITNANQLLDERQPAPAYHLGKQETTDNLAQFKNQYIRVHVKDMGWVIAQLLGSEPGGVVMLNGYYPGNPAPQFMRINRAELTGLSPLGFTPPSEITDPLQAPNLTMNQPQVNSSVIGGGWTVPGYGGGYPNPTPGYGGYPNASPGYPAYNRSEYVVWVPYQVWI